MENNKSEKGISELQNLELLLTCKTKGRFASEDRHDETFAAHREFLLRVVEIKNINQIY